MKPNTTQAMRLLINEVRSAIPFEIPISELCDGICIGCSKKLLDFLDCELESWHYRLDSGETPTFGDIQKLSKTSQKIYKALDRNGLIAKG